MMYVKRYNELNKNMKETYNNICIILGDFVQYAINMLLKLVLYKLLIIHVATEINIHYYHFEWSAVTVATN